MDFSYTTNWVGENKRGMASKTSMGGKSRRKGDKNKTAEDSKRVRDTAYLLHPMGKKEK